MRTLQLQVADGPSLDEQLVGLREARRRHRTQSGIGWAIAAAAAVLVAAATIYVFVRPSPAAWSLRGGGASPAAMSVHHPSARGAVLAGAGMAFVTTKGYFAAHERVTVFGGGEPRVVIADGHGRLHFRVDLGPRAPGATWLTQVALLPVPSS